LSIIKKKSLKILRKAWIENTLCEFKKIKLKEEQDASLLCEMQSQKRNERSQGNYDEKRQTGYPGCVSNLRHQNVQDWQK
jgi:hypothetical protein